MTSGQLSDYTGVAASLDSLLRSELLLAERDYDVDWFRYALKEKGDKGLHSRTKSPSNAHQIRQVQIQTP